jgi:hypothetical protein
LALYHLHLIFNQQTALRIAERALSLKGF